MNKKIISILCLSLVLLFCVPSFPALADTEIKIYTTESVDGYFEGNFTYDNNSVSRSDIASSLFLDFDSLSSNDQDNYITTLSSLPTHSDNYLVFSAGNSVFLYDFDSVVTFVNETSGFGGNTGRVLALSMDTFSGSYYSCSIGSTSWSTGVTFSSRFASGLCYFYFDSISLVKLLYTPLDLYSRVEADITNLELSDRSLRMYVSIYNGNSFGFTNYAGDSLPFYNGSQVVDPDAPVGETNENHLYLTNFDTGFCKPYHNNTLGTIGGAYVYMKYNFDSWVNSHISDYSLQVITQLDVNGTTTTYPSVWNLDAQGCTVLSLKTLAASFDWTQQNMLFLEYPNEVLFGNYVEGALYNMSSANYVNNNFYERAISGSGRGERLFISSNGTTHRLLGDSVDTDYFNGSTNTQFKISFIVRLVDNNSSETSGSFVETHDLISGISTVTNDQIRDNQNPYLPDNDVYIPVENSGGGYQVIDQGDSVVVNNLTPSQIKMIIDNGFEKFVAWYNSDPSTAEVSTGFWNSFGIFRNNPAADLYNEYFGFLPTTFKDIIFGCATIGIVGGVFCAIRRKLT